MSDDVLKIIPKNPDFIPAADTHEAAVLEFERLARGEMCEAKVYEAIAFIDQGENIQDVICPKCRQRTNVMDNPGGIWWDALTEQLSGLSDLHAEEIPPSELQATMPCCGSTVKMTELEFDWPGGFARFELSIWNPMVPRENLNAEQLARLEQILGCELKQVRAHY